MWWVKDPDRLKHEVAAVDALREQETWLTTAVPRLLKGLRFAFDFDVSVHGESFPFTLEYPAFFPATAPLVIPRDGRRLSTHQYGDGGELCLEYRSDNWDPSITGAMMMASTHRLLAGERPTRDERAVVPSAHHTSLGQLLRGTNLRFLVTRGFLDFVCALPVGSLRQANAIEIVAPKQVWTASIASVGATEAPEWREDRIPDRGKPRLPAWVLRVASLSEVPAVIDQAVLDQMLNGTGKSEAVPKDLSGSFFVVIADATVAQMYYAFPRDGGRAVLPYNLVDFAADHADRLPDCYGVLMQKKVGIVGCGSLGSKIAASLARSGVRDFVLVDDDIMTPGNLVRHELDADSLGAHKVEALEARLKAVAPGVTVSARRVGLGAQESSGSTASVLDELAACDLLIDATGDADAFNFVATVGRSALRAIVWAEVYAGGVGGLVARLRPGIEPPPHAARRQYLGWCREQGVPWRGDDREYGTRGMAGVSLVADDADVAVIAAHASRMAVDVLIRPDASRFPHPAYVIGLAREWIFGEPFDTRPIDFVADGEWRSEPSTERTVEALEFLASLFEPGEHADRTGT
jgi:hypothetical protein